MTSKNTLDTTTDDETLFELASLLPKQTGLPLVVWISPKMGAAHDVRVMVSYSTMVKASELISVTLRPKVRVIGDGMIEAHELALLKLWIELNYNTILDYWSGRNEDTIDVLSKMKPVQTSDIDTQIQP